MIRVEKHPYDGEWKTTWFEHKGQKIAIKSRKGSGMKVHVFEPNGSSKVLTTLRYRFANPEKLLQRAKEFIDQNQITV